MGRLSVCLTTSYIMAAALAWHGSSRAGVQKWCGWHHCRPARPRQLSAQLVTCSSQDLHTHAWSYAVSQQAGQCSCSPKSLWACHLHRVAVLEFIDQQVLHLSLHLSQNAAISENLHRLRTGALAHT